MSYGNEFWRAFAYPLLMSMVSFFIYALTVVVGFAILVGMLFVFGSSLETIGEYQEQKERCQKEAVRPYDYARCE